MEISISSRHGQLNQDARAYIDRKVPKLSHLFERLTSIHVTVDFQKNEPEVELLVSAEHKHDFVARERNATVHAAFDAAMSKMEMQLRKYKEKVQEHHRRPANEAGGMAAGEEA